ncbi:unnamed protein product [Polarella glacialis]|uniref:Uncharacterized protein n=1 Tax=Polarella glacialis TaxID=89957 RepID=A0A813H575_POLGL|nr:unnamed protein product [Polarella glacialis]CAE8648460.1 unnamed protein product [Polarella glacialis]
MDQRFTAVETQARHCWALGGRYWEFVLNTASYVAGFRISGGDAPCEGCLEDFAARWQQVPDTLIGGLCAPPPCGAAHVTGLIFTRHMERLLQLTFRLPAPDAAQAARELSHWSQLRLDFVVAGVTVFVVVCSFCCWSLA